MSERVKMLYLCNHNANRSQMAEGWTNHIRGQEFMAFSAGVEPTALDPRTVRVMGEEGVDLGGHRSKNIDEVGEKEFDYVVTLCAGAAENCPYFPAKTRVVHRSFDDPTVLAAREATEERKLAAYRRVRDEIKAFVEGLPDSLG